MKEDSSLIPFPREWSPQEIVEGLLNGDPVAGRAFFDSYQSRVNRLVWRMLGACSDHDDIVQQVFLNALQSIRKLRDPALLEHWLVGVTVNTVRGELRSRRFRRLFFPFGEDSKWSNPCLDPERQSLAYEFYTLLGRFHPEERLAFILCMVEDMTQMEAAHACGISLSTLKRRLARACSRVEGLARETAGKKTTGGVQDECDAGGDVTHES